MAVYSTFSGIIVLIVGLPLGFTVENWIASIPLMILIMVLTALGLTCLGLGIAARFKDTQSFQLIGNFLVFPFFLLSGAFFPLDKAPFFIQIISYWNPITYAIDAFRELSLGLGHLPLALNIAVLIAFLIASLVFATAMFEKQE